MKRFILTLAFALFCGLAWAQKPVLSTPSARQSGNDIIIDYSIRMNPGVICKIAIYLSSDGGRHFQNKPLLRVSGDVGIVSESGDKTVVWHVMEEGIALGEEELVFKVNVERFWNANVQQQPAPVKIEKEQKVKESNVKEPKVKEPDKSAIFVGPVVGFNTGLSFGAMAGWVGKVGVYGKLRSNFVGSDSSYECSSDGRTDDGYIWTSGNSRVSTTAITAGVILPVGDAFYPYVGAGFAQRTLTWEDTESRWVRVKDASSSGIGIDAGVILRFGSLGIHAGVNTTGFKYFGADAGVAFFF